MLKNRLLPATVGSIIMAMKAKVKIIYSPDTSTKYNQPLFEPRVPVGFPSPGVDLIYVFYSICHSIKKITLEAVQKFKSYNNSLI